MEEFFPYCAEPELEEIMNDPIIKRLMQKDGIEDSNMAPLLKARMSGLHIQKKQRETA